MFDLSFHFQSSIEEFRKLIFDIVQDYHTETRLPTHPPHLIATTWSSLNMLIINTFSMSCSEKVTNNLVSWVCSHFQRHNSSSTKLQDFPTEYPLNHHSPGPRWIDCVATESFRRGWICLSVVLRQHNIIYKTFYSGICLFPSWSLTSWCMLGLPYLEKIKSWRQDNHVVQL